LYNIPAVAHTWNIRLNLYGCGHDEDPHRVYEALSDIGKHA